VTPRDLIDVADRRMYESKVPAVAPPYEIEGVAAPDAGRAFRSARFQDAPLYPVDLRDRLRFASLNWLAAGLLTIAGAAIAAQYTYPVAAAACGVYALVFAALSESFRHVRLTRGFGKALDYGTLIFPFPAIAFVGGASSALLVTISLPVAFYAQNFKARHALPRIAILLAGFSAGFWFFGDQGPSEQTRYFTCLAAMLVVAGIMQYSSGLLAAALAMIRRSATRDQLTGLPNVYALRRDLESALREYRQDASGPVPALVVVDLDDFRRANTLAGHRGGDEVLKSVAKRLSDVAGESPIYRVEGDEFAIIVHGLTGRALTSYAERCARAAEYDHVFNGVQIEVRASVGYASSADRPTGDELVDFAEDALRRNKSDRRGAGPPPRSVLL
jgi:diguanylate cyclase (GGDEF)-like protein